MPHQSLPSRSIASERAAWYAVAVLLVAYISSIIDRVVLGFLVGPIKQAFAVSDTHIGLLTGIAFTVFYTTVGLPAGRLADTHSRRMVIVAGIVLWSVATMYCGLAASYSHLFLGRVLVGVGEATLGPAAYSLIADMFPAARRSMALSVYSMGITIGTGLATVIAGSVIALTKAQSLVVVPLVGDVQSWQYVFFVVGAPGLAIALLAVTLREPARETVREAAQENAEKKASSASMYAALHSLRPRWQAFTACVVGMGIFGMFNQGVNFWMPEMFVRTFGWAKPVIGQTQGWLIALFGTLGLFAGGRISAWLEQRGHADAKLRVMAVCAAGVGVMAGASFAASLVDTSGLTSLVMLAPTYFCSFAPYGVATALVQDLAPTQMRGQAGALFLLIMNLIGGGAGPVLVSTLTDYVFHSESALRFSMMLATVVATAGSSLLYWWGMKHLRQALRSPQAAL
jgi:MFS family permease